MNERTCKECLKTFSLDNFASAGVINGVEYKRHKCKSCYCIQKTQRKKDIKNTLLEYKKSLKCEKCGYSNFRALQFHHHNSDKEYTVADMVKSGFSFNKILNEISKCQVLCANCHQIEHYIE